MFVEVNHGGDSSQQESSEAVVSPMEPESSNQNFDLNRNTRTKRLMGHLIGTLTKCKDELNAQAPLLSKRSQLEEQVSLKRKSVEDMETAVAIKSKQKWIEEERLRREKEKEKRIKERDCFEQTALKEMELELERHHRTLSKFFMTKLPSPAINIFYKPKRLL